MADRDFNIDEGNWFPVMHEMADKLMVYRLSGTEWQVLMMFMRFCYGYQNSTCELRWKDIKDFTGLDRGTLYKAINRLKQRNIIKSFQKETKTGIRYKINSKISTWKRVAKRKQLPKGNQKGCQKETTPIKNNNKNNIYSRANQKIPYQEIISYLNDQAEKNFKFSTDSTKKTIKARWNEGFCFEDFKKVIDIKCSKWKSDPKMMDYLRPQTLFGTKFESYLNEKPEASEYERDDSLKRLT